MRNLSSGLPRGRIARKQGGFELYIDSNIGTLLELTLPPISNTAQNTLEKQLFIEKYSLLWILVIS